MPTTDLPHRARSAVTQDDECTALRAAVCHFITDAMQALPLIDIIVSVRPGRAPRPVLLGVVAALVPEGMGWGVNGPFIHADGGTHWEASCGPLDEIDGGTPALALLIAILEASHV